MFSNILMNFRFQFLFIKNLHLYVKLHSHHLTCIRYTAHPLTETRRHFGHDSHHSLIMMKDFTKQFIKQ